MQLAMRERQVGGRWKTVIEALAFGLILGIMGPFGSQSALEPAVRYPFWVVLSFAGFALCAAAGRLVPPRIEHPASLKRAAILALLSAVPMTFIVAWSFSVVQDGRTFSPVELAKLFPFVALVQFLIAYVMHWGGTSIDSNRDQEPTHSPQYPQTLLTKLPYELRSDILALEAEDHYLRVHSLHGNALVLMRLSDAIAAIDPQVGLRVHRSWWVAKEGVREIRTSGSRTVLLLRIGMEVPISRSRMADVKASLSD